jgi:hypothetical protein
MLIFGGENGALKGAILGASPERFLVSPVILYDGVIPFNASLPSNVVVGGPQFANPLIHSASGADTLFI